LRREEVFFGSGEALSVVFIAAKILERWRKLWIGLQRAREFTICGGKIALRSQRKTEQTSRARVFGVAARTGLRSAAA